MSVFVLDRRGKSLMPCSEKRARPLLERGRARVARRYPFTIRLIDRTAEESVLQPVRIKIDPGSKTTGFAIVREHQGETVVLALAELAHRGADIRDVPKVHATDAGCVGEVQALTAWRRPIPSIKVTGQGAYQRTRLDRFGFPRGTLMRAKRAGKKAGTNVGRVAIRASNKFNIKTADGVVQGIHAKHFRRLARSDGYAYELTHELLSSPGLKPRVSRSLIR